MPRQRRLHSNHQTLCQVLQHAKAVLRIGYDTPENYRKRYYKGELLRKNTFEGRKLTAEPKFVQKRRQLADSKDAYEDVSTFEKEIPEKS